MAPRVPSCLPIVLIVLIVALLGAKAASVPDELRAKKFTLVNASGKVLATLGPSLGGTTLVLFDHEGREGILFHASSTLSEGYLSSDGVRRVWLMAMEPGAGILVGDPKGTSSGSLSADEISVSEGEKTGKLAIQTDGS